MDVTLARKELRMICVLITPFVLSACLMNDSAESASSLSPPPPPSNGAPTISGVPPQDVVVGADYLFVPTASDPNSDPLTFSITNLPNWATFDSGTGMLTGVPFLGSAGVYQNIRISVSDGSLSSSLPDFTVAVNQVGLGSVTLSWTPPTQNTDGTTLMDLNSYRVYYGSSAGNYPNRIDLDNPGLSSYVVDNLSSGTYFFVATAVNDLGMESNFSNVAQKVVN